MRSKSSVVSWLACLVSAPMLLLGWGSAPAPAPARPSSGAAVVGSDAARGASDNAYPVFSAALNPARRYDRARGVDFVSQIPVEAPPIAVLFLAHGCGRSARVFWDPHSGCPTCLGLPEERAFVITALAHGFAVIAISSSAICWNLKQDVHNVAGILRDWIAEEGLENLPVVALGSSTGGWFVSRFARQFHLDAVALVVSEGRFRDEEFGDNSTASRYPATLFVHMVKDAERAKQIRVDMAWLAARGVPAAEHVSVELPLLADFFCERVPYIDKATSAQMVDVLAATGCLTSERLLRSDARWFDWGLVLEEKGLLPSELRAHVEQELNVAFAFHEFCSLAAPEVLQWFLYHMQARNLPTLAS